MSLARTDLPPKNARSKPLQEFAVPRDAVEEVQGPELRPAPPTKPRRTARIAVAGALPPAHIPAEALRSPPTQGLFATALTISLVLHLVVAAVHFSPFDFTRFKDNEPPLEIALVNAKSSAKPTKADILAQANLDGGGNTDLPRRAKSPLPVLPNETPGKDVSVATQSVEALKEQQRELLTRLKSTALVKMQPTPVEAPEKTDSPTANDLMQKALEAIRLEAQIAKDMDAYQKRPKRTFIGARAAEFRFARYVEDWRLKIERIGNLNYPEAARQQKLYGSLLLTVSIRSDGSIENVEINRTSGQRVLDAAAVKIVQMSAPFAAFPPDIKRDTDILHITRTWTFAKGDELTSQ
jgi:protein TonB